MCMSTPSIPAAPPPPAAATPDDPSVMAARARERKRQAAVLGYQSTRLTPQPFGKSLLGE